MGLTPKTCPCIYGTGLRNVIKQLFRKSAACLCSAWPWACTPTAGNAWWEGLKRTRAPQPDKSAKPHMWYHLKPTKPDFRKCPINSLVILWWFVEAIEQDRLWIWHVLCLSLHPLHPPVYSSLLMQSKDTDGTAPHIMSTPQTHSPLSALGLLHHCQNMWDACRPTNLTTQVAKSGRKSTPGSNPWPMGN